MYGIYLQISMLVILSDFVVMNAVCSFYIGSDVVPQLHRQSNLIVYNLTPFH